MSLILSIEVYKNYKSNTNGFQYFPTERESKGLEVRH